jgi:aryl-alcohol dehydrogenase-like predicted oxidoreductase
MNYTRLGQTDLNVSRVCFGSWAFSGDWGAVEKKEAHAAVRRALELGVNFFDTAEAYGWGAAEETLGEALRGELANRRDEIVLATKGGLRAEDGKLVRDSSPESLRRGIEGSLRRLDTDYVDLYQVHWPDANTPLETTAGVMDELVREGKARYVGVSNYGEAEMERFERRRKLDALQPPYHMLRRDIEAEILPYCQRRGIGVLVYSPLAHGLLTGKFGVNQTFPEDDWRSGHAMFQGEAFRANLETVEDLDWFSRERRYSVAQLAVAWTLANPAVDVAIVGARRVDQIEGTHRAAELELSEEDLREIDRIIRRAVPVDGPTPEM